MLRFLENPSSFQNELDDDLLPMPYNAAIINLAKKISNRLFSIDDKVATEVDVDNNNNNTITDELSEPMAERLEKFVKKKKTLKFIVITQPYIKNLTCLKLPTKDHIIWKYFKMLFWLFVHLVLRLKSI